nr:replication associated protein [Banfec virus 5]
MKVEMSMQQRSRGWAFTVNNWTEEEYQKILAIDSLYTVIGKEKGEQGTAHLQGYIYFRNQRTFNTVKALIGERAHIEKAHGTPEQNKKYCTKDNDFIEKGECPVQGKRTDIELAALAIQDGKNLLDLEKDHLPTLIHYWHGLESYRRALLRRKAGRRQTKRVSFWIYGPARKGKTRRAMEIAEAHKLLGHSIFSWAPAKDFIDGYDGEEVAIFDDFRGTKMDFAVWLQICDPWHNPAINVKGGTTAFIADICIFTSILPPVQEWKRSIGDIKVIDPDQITDRLEIINIIQPNPDDTPLTIEEADEFDPLTTPEHRLSFD